jgi:hypothetical protein
VHWLLEDESGRLIWHKSKGNIRELCKYIYTQNPIPENLDDYLKQARCQKVMLIADTAGKGKTTVLTHLSEKIKQQFPTYWVIKVDLSDHTDVLKDVAKQGIRTNEFLCEKLLKLEDTFEKELLKRCCQGLEATKMVLMFDGFNEISPMYKRNALLVAASKGHLQTVVTLWGWGKEVKLNLKDDLLLAKGSNGETAWHLATQNGKKEILEKLWSWGKEEQVNLKDDLLLSKDLKGRTAWNLFAMNRCYAIEKQLIAWGREVQVNF